MAIQQWTVIKIVGPAAANVAHRFDGWLRARRTDDPSMLHAPQWPRATRQAVGRLLARLHEHRLQMPIAYYSQHTDLWSSGGEAESFGFDDQVVHDGGELWCHMLPDRGRLLRHAKKRVADARQSETKWLATRLIDAADAYQKLWRDATILLHRDVIAVSSSDEELIQSSAHLPDWISGRVTGKERS